MATRNPVPTEPLMSKSLRTDFPPSMEREIVDGGVAEGRPESPLLPGLVWLVLLFFGGLAALLAYLWWATPWFH